MTYDPTRFFTPMTAPDPMRYAPDVNKYADDILGYLDKRSARASDEQFRNAQLQREIDRDVRNDERERVGQRQHAIALSQENARANSREALYQQMEDRRAREAQLNREHLDKQEHEKLIQDLYNATNTGDPRAIQFAIDALKRAGYPVEEIQHTQEIPVTVSASSAPSRPMTKDEQSLSSQLDAADASYSKALGAKPAPAKLSRPEADKLSGQLDAADQYYSKGLGVSPWLPGKSPVARQNPNVTLSDQLLSADDPYNQLVK